MVESQREQRRIRCSGCQEHIWLRYSYTDKKPLTAVGIDCPRDDCQKLNRVYMPETATGIEVGMEPSPEISTAPPPSEVTGETNSLEAPEAASVPDVEAPAEPPSAAEPRSDGKGPEGKAPRKNVYWRPPRF